MPFINGIGPGELIIILIIALIVVGPGKLPDVGSALGKSIREFRKAATDIKDVTNLDPQPAQASAQAAPAAAPVAAPAVPVGPAPAPVAPAAAPLAAAAPVAAAAIVTAEPGDDAADSDAEPAEAAPVDQATASA